MGSGEFDDGCPLRGQECRYHPTSLSTVSIHTTVNVSIDGRDGHFFAPSRSRSTYYTSFSLGGSLTAVTSAKGHKCRQRRHLCAAVGGGTGKVGTLRPDRSDSERSTRPGLINWGVNFFLVLLLVLQSRFGDSALIVRVVHPQNKTDRSLFALKGSTRTALPYWEQDTWNYSRVLLTVGHQ